jgi:hypothetical protein
LTVVMRAGRIQRLVADIFAMTSQNPDLRGKLKFTAGVKRRKECPAGCVGVISRFFGLVWQRFSL